MAQWLSILIGLSEDPCSILSTQRVACHCLLLQLQGTQYSFLTFICIAYMWYTEMHAARISSTHKNIKFLKECFYFFLKQP